MLGKFFYLRKEEYDTDFPGFRADSPLYHKPRARSRARCAFGAHRYFLSDDPMSVPLSMEDTR